MYNPSPRPTQDAAWRLRGTVSEYAYGGSTSTRREVRAIHMDGGDVVDEDAFSDTMRGLVQANCGLLPVSVSGQTDEDRRNSILCNGIPKAGGVAQSVEHRPFKRYRKPSIVTSQPLTSRHITEIALHSEHIAGYYGRTRHDTLLATTTTAPEFSHPSSQLCHAMTCGDKRICRRSKRSARRMDTSAPR